MVMACVALLGVLLAGCGSVASSAITSGAGASGATATPTQRPTYVYVAIGASETFGYGADRPYTQSYPADLGAHLPNGGKVDDLGMNGFTTHDALLGELPEALDANPDLVTVWLGFNDILQNVSLAKYQPDLDTILTQLATKTHAQVAIANLPDLTLLPYFNTHDPTTLKAEVQQMNTVIAQEAAAHHDILIDVYAHSAELIGHPEYISGDGLHPSTLGYQQIANLFYQVLHTNGVI